MRCRLVAFEVVFPELLVEGFFVYLLALFECLQKAAQQEAQMVVYSLADFQGADSEQLSSEYFDALRKLKLELQLDQVFDHEQKGVRYHQILLEQLFSFPNLHDDHQSGFQELVDLEVRALRL